MTIRNAHAHTPKCARHPRRARFPEHARALSLSTMRAAASAIACAVALWALLACTGCAGLGAENGADASNAAAKASSEIPNPSDALGDSYEQALEKAREGAGDVVLLSVRTSDYVTAESDGAHWMYLFGSPSQECSYTVFVSEDFVTCGEYCTVDFDEEDWAEIHDVSEVSVDAPSAYESVIEQCYEGERNRPYSLGLTLYRADDDNALFPLYWYVYTVSEDEYQTMESTTVGSSGVSADGHLVSAETGTVH